MDTSSHPAPVPNPPVYLLFTLEILVSIFRFLSESCLMSILQWGDFYNYVETDLKGEDGKILLQIKVNEDRVDILADYTSPRPHTHSCLID